jgi:SAM-dependent methyltransferase
MVLSAQRHDTFRYESLPAVGRVSLWLGNRRVVRHLKPGTWLDLLCGERALLQRSQLASRKFTALYAADHTLDATLSDVGVNLTACRVDRELPYADAAFDNITLINGLEHLWWPQEVLSECNRMLRPGGILQVVVPTWFGKPFLEFIAFRLNNSQARIEMNDHKMYYDEKSLWPMLVRAGFVPEHIKLSRFKFWCSLHALVEKGC